MSQIDIFEALYDTFKFNKKTINLFEAFAGIGTQHMAMKLLQKEFDFEINVIGISEIDKYAIKSYNAIHGETKNFGSICDIEWLPSDIDIFTYSFPCQDISLAGNGKGFTKGDNTRSGLLWEVERLLKCSDKPQVLIMENVKNLISEEHRPNFVEWIIELEKLGYSNYWQVLNAKDYGIPQNRERVFMVSILGNYNYNWPQKIQLVYKLQDYLEEVLDVSYFPEIGMKKAINETKIETTEFTQFKYNNWFEQSCRVWKNVFPTIHTKAKKFLYMIKTIMQDTSQNWKFGVQWVLTMKILKKLQKYAVVHNYTNKQETLL